jgi:hypothetical protein
MPTVNTCSICQAPYAGYGNNAYPVNEGRCCDDCNSMTVIPARIRAMVTINKQRIKQPKPTGAS